MQLTKEDAAHIEKNLNAPFLNVNFSTLGGVDKGSITVGISLDEKENWSSGIFHNSRYSHFHITPDGKIEQFSKCYRIKTKFRKSNFKTVDEAIAKIQAWIVKSK